MGGLGLAGLDGYFNFRYSSGAFSKDKKFDALCVPGSDIGLSCLGLSS